MRSLVAACIAILWTFGLSAAHAQDRKDSREHVAGEFDYYVLALSWTPNWCAQEGDKRKDDRCRKGGGTGWGVHGLWPQYESRWPEFCRTAHRDPSRQQTAAMADFMGAPGLAWHQWKKHGRCSGLSAADYFATTERAFRAVALPPVFDQLERDIRLPARVVEQAFLERNPQLQADMLTVTCRRQHIQEVRICLTRDLQPRRCAPDTIRDCRLDDAQMTPQR